MGRCLPVGLLLTLAVAGCQDASVERDAAGSATWSIEEAKVLYTGRRGGSSDLYVLDRRTGESRRLTTFGGSDSGANAGRISPEGARVAFQVRRESDYDIHVMELAGGPSRNLTSHPEYDVGPTWSPDGTRLAFMSTRGFELGALGPFPGHIYVMELATGELRPVTHTPLTSSLGPSDWSADGSTLLMARVYDGRPDVVSLDVESGGEARITETADGEYSAAYSHSGDLVAFHAETDEESHIVVSGLDGSGRRVLTAGPGLRYYPRWSPNDEWILFTASDDGEQYDLRAVRISDGRVVEILATTEDEREGSWAPTQMSIPLVEPSR